jgi:hypothetical protein
MLITDQASSVGGYESKYFVGLNELSAFDLTAGSTPHT